MFWQFFLCRYYCFWNYRWSDNHFLIRNWDTRDTHICLRFQRPLWHTCRGCDSFFPGRKWNFVSGFTFQIPKRNLICFQTWIEGRRRRGWQRMRWAGGEGDDRGWGGCLTSLTQWTWVWASSGRWWGTGKAGMLRSMRSQSTGLSSNKGSG